MIVQWLVIRIDQIRYCILDKNKKNELIDEQYNSSEKKFQLWCVIFMLNNNKNDDDDVAVVDDVFVVDE